MPGKLKTFDHHLLTRRCVQCGYDDSPIISSQLDRCPRCDCDLRQRPPRSYAEMEGLLGHPLTISSPRLSKTIVNEESLVQRWLAVLFCAMMLIVMIVCLSAAAVPG